MADAPETSYHHGHSVHADTVEDVACAMAHGDVPAPTDHRRLVAVFASPVAFALAHIAVHVGYDVLLLEPDDDRPTDPWQRAPDVAGARLDPTTDVVVTDHDRAELGDVLAAVLRQAPRWIGVMGSPRHTAPHVAVLQERGVPQQEIARVHRPIGLNIGSRSPAEIAVATVAGLLADRNNRPGGPF